MQDDDSTATIPRDEARKGKGAIFSVLRTCTPERRRELADRFYPPSRQLPAKPPSPVVQLPRTAPRARGAGRPAARTTTRASSRGGDSGDDGEPGEPSPASSWRSPQKLFTDLEQYLRRIGPHGAERSWLVEQVAFLGHPMMQVSVALSVLVSMERARAGWGDADVPVVWRAR